MGDYSQHHNYGMTRLARRWIEEALKQADVPHVSGYRHNHAEPSPETLEHHERVDRMLDRILAKA